MEGCGLAMGLRGMEVLRPRSTRHGVEGAGWGAEGLRCAAKGGLGAGYGAEGSRGAESFPKGA